MSRMRKFWRWVGSADCELIDCEGNGYGRGDGYDVSCYRSRSTGRYLVVTCTPTGGDLDLWLATTEAGARAVYRWSPGVYRDSDHPYTRVVAPERLREVRAIANGGVR